MKPVVKPSPRGDSPYNLTSMSTQTIGPLTRRLTEPRANGRKLQPRVAKEQQLVVTLVVSCHLCFGEFWWPIPKQLFLGQNIIFSKPQTKWLLCLYITSSQIQPRTASKEQWLLITDIYVYGVTFTFQRQKLDIFVRRLGDLQSWCSKPEHDLFWGLIKWFSCSNLTRSEAQHCHNIQHINKAHIYSGDQIDIFFFFIS